jgi:hypothetical protein
LAVLGGACAESDDGAVGVAAIDASPDTASPDTSSPDTTSEASVDSGADAACSLTKPYSSKNAACNACAQAECCAEVNGCLGDPRCDDDYVNCILACAFTAPTDGGDAGAEKDACLAACATSYPVGKAAYDAAIGCVDSKCNDDCK